MHFLYPSDPIDPRRPDETFRHQADAMRKAGFGLSIVPVDELAEKNCRIRSSIPSGATVVYRGWMLAPTDYQALAALIQASGARPLCSLEEYLACHCLPNWYPLIAEFTTETKIFSMTDDLAGELQALGWGKFFVKDYVKSLKTSVGSVISRPEEITNLLSEMQKFRGTIEGGVCVRRFEEFVPDSERRYFVIRGEPHAASGSVPDLVFECVRRIKSPFFAIDVAVNEAGIHRVVEIGDGQLSDLVGWDSTRFAELWKGSRYEKLRPRSV